jgi:histidinol-phosphate aminotransferase
MTRPQPRKSILDIKPYVPGKAGAEGKTYKLSSNESALGPAPSAVEALKDTAAAAHLYPDGSAASLKRKLAELNGIEEDRLIIGNGSDEVLSLVARCFTEPGDEVLITKHGFSYYPLCAMAEACVPVMTEEDDLTADVDHLLAAVTEKSKVLFLANPNNPTGTLLAQQEVRRLREALPEHIMLVLDGAYAEYIDDPDYDPGFSLVHEAERSGADNVIMTRTFSKIYGLGGLRVGWGYAPASVIDIMNRVRGPFNVGAGSLAAAEAALGDQNFVEKNRLHNDEEMRRLEGVLTQRGYRIRTTYANFILAEFESEDEAMRFLRHCEAEGVMIRGLASSNLPRHVRVSVGSRDANDAFLAAATTFTQSD